MEVPQLISINGGCYLLFSCWSGMLSSLGRKRFGDITGSYYLYGESPLGPFRFLNDKPLIGDEKGSYYSAKMLRGPDNKWYLLAFKILILTATLLVKLLTQWVLKSRMMGI
jgi:beta-fructofuranosidase